MTRDEAIAVARAISYADGGCSGCVEEVCQRLNEKNLGWSWTVYEARGEGEVQGLLLRFGAVQVDHGWPLITLHQEQSARNDEERVWNMEHQEQLS